MVTTFTPLVIFYVMLPLLDSSNHVLIAVHTQILMSTYFTNTYNFWNEKVSNLISRYILLYFSYKKYFIHITEAFNQAHASLWPARAWFLEIAFVRNVSMCVCMRACVCPPPRL